MTEPTAIVQWDPATGALPAYLAEAMGELGTNIADRMSVPSLSYEGKTWSIHKDGNKTKLQSQNADGDMVPVQVMRMVILKYNDERGRTFYEGTYNPAESKQPLCWSPDSKAPSGNAKVKQHHVCNGCPQSIKGSKVDQGREMVACSSHRMIAIVPAGDMSMDPLRLKIAVTSDWDKEIVEHGWFAFRQYADYLKSRGISHTALVVTKVKFDANAPHPKLLFAIDRPLTPDEVKIIIPASKNPKVVELLAEKWTAAGVNGNTADESDTRPHGLEGAGLEGWLPHPEAAGYFYKGQEVVESAVLAARYPAPEPKAPAAPPAAPAAPAAPEVPASQVVIDAPVREVAPAAPPVPAHDPLAAAQAAGWVDHPQAPGFMYLGQEVVATADVLAKFPAPAAAAPTPAAPPAPPPAPEPVAPSKTPLEQATEAGWVDHPQAPGFMYLGQEVVATADVLAKFAGNAGASAGTPATTAGAATPAPADQGTAGTGTSATGASPSSPAPSGAAEIPADVQGLLDKWG